MEVVKEPDTAWEATVTCHRCETVVHVTTDDLQAEGFKKPGTYWFDGSADATVIRRVFVQCPNCHECVFVDGGGPNPERGPYWASVEAPEIPYMVRRRLGVAR